MKNKHLVLTLSIASLLSLSGCKEVINGGESKDPIAYDGINLYFNTSDKELMNFMNDYTHRHMRYDDDSIGEVKVTGSTGFAKNWESMAVSFQNSCEQVYGDDRIANIADYLINNSSQDSHGLIYNSPMTFEPAMSAAGDDASGYAVPQGWPFPNWQHSVSNYYDKGSFEAVNAIEFNFNDAGNYESQDWHASNGTFVMRDNLHDVQEGYGVFSSDENLSSNSSYMFYREDIDELLTNAHGIDTRYAPMIDMEIEFTGRNIKDYNIIFKVAGDNSWHRAPQSVYASTPINKLDSVHVRQFFDMYLNPEWNRKIVTDLGVEFVGKDGTTFQVNSGKINFLRPSYDTRQSNHTYQFILALYNYFVYTRDIKTLTKLMTKARKGLLFLTHALEGEKGLLSLEYLYGHDGIAPYSMKDKIDHQNDRLAYHGLSNGYWDLTVSPIMNLEANTYFYQALKAMAVLEEAMTYVPGDNKSSATILNRMPNGEPVAYGYDVATLNALAETVKTNMQKDIMVVREDGTTPYNAGDYQYKNKGGF